MKEMIRVLIADDSVAFGKACQKELKSGGFDCVLTADPKGRQPGDFAVGRPAL